MTKPTSPYQPYALVHENPQGEGDARPTALQIVQDCNAIGKLKGKTVLITGCTAGIGIETARAMYATGAQLILTARDMPKLERVIEDIVSSSSSSSSNDSPSPSPPPPRPIALELHLDSLASVRRAAAEATQLGGGKLHVLIGNAGVMAVPLGRTADGFETHMGTNHLAHFLLFQLLKPALLAGSSDSSSSTSRVVILSSALHRRGGPALTNSAAWAVPPASEGEYDKWLAYGHSKTANIWMANALDRRYARRGITAVAVHPGGIRTELGRYQSAEEIAAANLDQYAARYKSAAQGAATSVWAAVAPHFDGGRNGGRYVSDCGEAAPLVQMVAFAGGYSPHAYDEAAEERLWELSCGAVGVPVD